MARKVQLRHLHELEEHLEVIASGDTWSNRRASCAGCHKTERPLCKTPKGKVCASCAIAVLRMVADKEELAAWHFSRFREALSPEGELRSRLTILWRFQEAAELTSKQSSEDVDALRQDLVRNLGYAEPHPLAQRVRQAAHETCVTIGESIVPLLLDMCEADPWQFYANIVLSVGKIAPENTAVQTLMENAAQDTNPKVRGCVLTAISEHDTPWARKVFRALAHDADPLVRELIPLVTEAWGKTDRKSQTQTPKVVIETPIETIVEKSYSADTLKKLYLCYLHHFFNENDFVVKGNFSVNKLKKTELVRLLSTVYSDKDLFHELLSHLSEGVRNVLDLLVWDGGEHRVETLRKMFQTEIMKTEEKQKYGKTVSEETIRDEYLLFRFRTHYRYTNYTYSLYLPDELRKQFKTCLPIPKEADILPFDHIEDTEFVYEDGDQIISQIRLFCSYIQQGHLKSSKNSDKILKTALRQMAGYCNILEFYENKDKALQFMRTQLLTDFLTKAQISESGDPPQELLKQIFHDFFTAKKTKWYEGYKLNGLLYHLKGMHNVRSGYHGQSHEKNERNVRQSLFSLLKKMPPSQWVSAENLLKYSLYRDIDLDIVDRGAAKRYLSFHKKNEGDRKYSYRSYEQVYVTFGLYHEALLKPFFRAVLFLFASFGILDLAYNLPENKVIREKDHEHLSVFDGLKYIRLTGLGAYILGVADDYGKTPDEEVAKITLDENRLIISMEGKDPLLSLVLKKLGDKISENCYKVDYNSFLKTCTTKEEIEQKVALFKDQISADPPRVWQDFLDELLGKVNPLIPKGTMIVYKLKPEKELISLIAKDEILKKYVLKAENYHILVDSMHRSKVKKRLEGFGYFIDRM